MEISQEDMLSDLTLDSITAFNLEERRNEK